MRVIEAIIIAMQFVIITEPYLTDTNIFDIYIID